MTGVSEPVPESVSPTSRRLPFAFARAHGAVVMSAPDHPELKVGLREDADPLVLIEVRRVLGQGFAIERLSRDAFERQLSETYAGEGLSTTDSGNEDLPEGLAMLADELPEEADLLDSQDDAPVIRLINGILAEAARIGASDVHIEPFESRLMVRARVDGVLREMLRLNPRLAPLLVSRIKVMARLDIAEKRLPQDGRITLTYGGRNLDVRVSTLPAKVGERVVMRLLSRDSGTLDLTRLGMPAPVLTAFGAALAEPNGIVLITGPTGSGKTTTLYSGLSRLNDATRNILTIEDPVEYGLDGIGQTQVNTKVGMTFAAGLRAILRQDPDVVMVGEIRDSETAQIAVQASLTGHLVLSTVHTNDAVGAVTRLRDMGVEPFLLASTLRVVIAQRLVRRLCGTCRVAYEADPVTAAALAVKPGTTLYRPAGCADCNHTGYTGRTGVYECVVVDDPLRRLIVQGADELALADHAFRNAQRLSDSVRAAVLDGVTAYEEMIRVTRSDSSGPVGEGQGPHGAL